MGAGAGIAAAFNAPLAGTVFVGEPRELHGSWGFRVCSLGFGVCGQIIFCRVQLAARQPMSQMILGGTKANQRAFGS